MNPSITIIVPELFPVPALKGGAFSIWVEQLVPHIKAGRVTVISASDSSLPRSEVHGNVSHRRIAARGLLSSVGVYLSRVPILGRRLGPQLHGYAYLRALLPQIQDADLIYILNRPQFVRAVKSRAPGASVILRLGNLHLQSPGSVRRADWVDCCSEFVASRVRQAIGRHGQVGVTMEGVDCELYRPPQEKERETLRRNLGFLDDEMVVLYVGRLVPEKGVHLIVDAARLLKQRIPRVHFLIVGDSNDTSYKQSLHSNVPDNVHFLGQKMQLDIAWIMRACDLFVGPSLCEEAAGRVFGEAMASGLPVVATRRGGIPETVESSGGGILLSPSPTVDDVVESIVDLAANSHKRDAMGQAGREWAKRHLDWPTVARTIEEMVAKVYSARI